MVLVNTEDNKMLVYCCYCSYSTYSSRDAVADDALSGLAFNCKQVSGQNMANPKRHIVSMGRQQLTPSPLQIWRLFTNFCFLGKFGWPFVMNVIFM